jgi:hypothetical protein
MPGCANKRDHIKNNSMSRMSAHLDVEKREAQIVHREGSSICLWVTANNVRVGVVACVGEPPRLGQAKHHERCQLVPSVRVRVGKWVVVCVGVWVCGGVGWGGSLCALVVVGVWVCGCGFAKDGCVEGAMTTGRWWGICAGSLARHGRDESEERRM